MRKFHKSILILGLLFLSVFIFIIGGHEVHKIREDAGKNAIPSEKKIWIEFQEDFTDEEVIKFHEAMDNGLNVAEAIKISNPDKYDELKKDAPHVLKIFENRYKDSIKKTFENTD
ncbi:MAG: hypothetical protein JEZ08_25325 [Clostridiales bacterium]|nr:hypothetical protein [Clostridiales bacterium]